MDMQTVVKQGAFEVYDDYVEPPSYIEKTISKVKTKFF